jgi:hypothetical protein
MKERNNNKGSKEKGWKSHLSQVWSSGWEMMGTCNVELQWGKIKTAERNGEMERWRDGEIERRERSLQVPGRTTQWLEKFKEGPRERCEKREKKKKKEKHDQKRARMFDPIFKIYVFRPTYLYLYHCLISISILVRSTHFFIFLSLPKSYPGMFRFRKVIIIWIEIIQLPGCVCNAISLSSSMRPEVGGRTGALMQEEWTINKQHNDKAKWKWKVPSNRNQ